MLTRTVPSPAVMPAVTLAITRNGALIALIGGLIVALAGCDAVFGVDRPDAGSPDGDRRADAGADAVTDGRSLDASEEPDARVVTACPAGYHEPLNSLTQYRYVATPATWAMAAADCADDELAPSMLRTHLVVFSGDVEKQAVLSGQPGVQAWIGLSDRATPAEFQWVTDEMVNYPPLAGGVWEVGQPSHGFNEECVITLPNGNFDDVGCAQPRPYFCECDAFFDDPTNYQPAP